MNVSANNFNASTTNRTYNSTRFIFCRFVAIFNGLAAFFRIREHATTWRKKKPFAKYCFIAPLTSMAMTPKWINVKKSNSHFHWTVLDTPNTKWMILKMQIEFSGCFFPAVPIYETYNVNDFRLWTRASLH